MVHRVVRDLRSLVVTNDRRERCHQHQGTIQILLDLLEIRFGTLNQELAEVRTIVTHDGDGVDDYPPCEAGLICDYGSREHPMLRHRSRRRRIGKLPMRFLFDCKIRHRPLPCGRLTLRSRSMRRATR